MAASQTSSRLQLLQARFQQKQLQEKEQKLLQLYDQQQQRAHQVAQRGSAGSNGSNGSSHGSIVGPPAGKVRQMYDDRRQTNVKGIDKSYPLEPLDARSKKHTSGKPVVAAKPTGARRNAAAPGVTKSRSVTRADVNSNVSSGSRTVVLAQRESFSSTRSTEEYHEHNAGESIRQVNGHARNGHHQQHYEINIDEVIDNEAMERNRMLAKFRPIDIENQRRSFSGDIEAEEFPAEMGLRDDKAASPPARKSSPTEAKAERFKNTNTRKSSTTLAAAAPQTTTKKRSEPAIPTGANARQSTVMKTTKSASLKIKKLPRNKKAFENKKKSSMTQKAKPIKKKSKETMTEESKCSENEENLSKKFSSLKSTSLICEILRNHNRIEKTTDTTDMGKVKTIVTKIENTTKEIKTETNNAIKSNQKTESIVVNKTVISTPSVSVTKKRPSLFDSDLCKMTKKEPIKVSRQDDQNTALKNIENEDKGDGLIHRGELTSSLAIRGNRESSVEHPTERQEITIADQTTIKAPSEKQHREEEEEEDDEKDDQVLQTDYKRLSGSCASNRVRRASFELKCMMFEQMQAASAAGNDKFNRRDSVESALRHFDSIGVDVTDFSEPSKDGKKSILALNPASAPPNENSNNADCASPESDYSTVRLCTRDSPEKEPGTQTTPTAGVKGFERHTSAWSMKTLKAGKPPQQLIAKVAVTPVISRRIVSRKKLLLLPKKHYVSKKLLEARDSIELARVSVKPRIPSCRRKLNFNSSAGSPAEKVTQTTPVASTTTTSEEAATPVQSQSFSSDNSGRVAQLKSVFLVLQIAKTDDTFAPSTRIADSIPKRADSRASDSIQRKNVIPYPSSKSPDIEQRGSRLATKTPSLKLLNRAGDSSDDAAQYASENGISTAARKSSLSAVDYSDSPADPRNQSFDDEKPVTPAPRTAATSSHSSTSSLGPSRNQQGPRAAAAAKAKSNAGTPAPAHRSSPAKAASNNDDSLTTCKICNRRFTTERITLHEQICSKTSQKKRKQFDAVIHRVKGTELEPFVVQKPTKKQGKAAAAAAAKKASAATEEAAKSNWRRKHEDFINAIRSAKQMQAHLAAGGKLSDLPPPPPSDTSDYVQCPHCSRKFNQGAAERHIPKCENMQHNKPRAQPRSKR